MPPPLKRGPMESAMSGIHHITAIAGSAERNFDFYTRVLGLRLVKKTVNFDDPGTYHLYFGDESGQPGTILTFFPWAHVAKGRNGIGMANEVLFQVPANAIGYWAHRLVQSGVTHDGVSKRFGRSIITFKDPDGLSLAVVGVQEIKHVPAWQGGGVTAEHAIRGFYGVGLMLEKAEATVAILKDVFGFVEDGREGDTLRLKATGADVGGIVEIREVGGFLHGRMGAGTIHHVAFRAKSDDEQAELRRKLAVGHKLQVTEQLDRNYFRSIYFREPGGVLFEVATDQPGFSVDEPLAELGRSLKLPASLEDRRTEIEAVLVPLEAAA